jgi:hypothetical protein
VDECLFPARVLQHVAGPGAYEWHGPPSRDLGSGGMVGRVGCTSGTVGPLGWTGLDWMGSFGGCHGTGIGWCGGADCLSSGHMDVYRGKKGDGTPTRAHRTPRRVLRSLRPCHRAGAGMHFLLCGLTGGMVAGRHSMTGVAGADVKCVLDQSQPAWLRLTGAGLQTCSSVGWFVGRRRPIVKWKNLQMHRSAQKGEKMHGQLQQLQPASI